MTSSSVSIHGPSFDLGLSDWDRRFPASHSKRVLGFSLPPDTDKDHVTSVLTAALESLAQDIPFLCGSVIPLPKKDGGAPWLRSITSDGALLFKTKDLSRQVSWSHLSSRRFHHSLLKAEVLCPLPAVSAPDKPISVCALQANYVEGGLFLVISIIHCICDGIGITEILDAFAAKAREAFQQDRAASRNPDQRTERPWAFDRATVLHGNSSKKRDLLHHPAWTVQPPNVPQRLREQPTSSCIFHITATGLKHLKQIASKFPTTEVTYISTHDAIVAFLWRAIILARHRAGLLGDRNSSSTYEGGTHLTQPVDCRKRLRLPEPYYGNAIYGVRAQLPLTTIADLETGLSTAARAVRAEINAVTAECFQDLLAFVHSTQQEAHTRLKAADEMLERGVMVTSYWGMGMYDLDFGGPLGKPDIFRLPDKGYLTGLQVIMPRLEDGSCEVVVTEATGTMEQLKGDEWFGRFAEEINP